MTVMNWLKTNIGAARDTLQTEFGRFKNRDMMDAVVAGCALVAAADGHIDAAEKQKMVGYLQNSPEMKVFKLDEVIASFNKQAGALEFDRDLGRIEALKTIGKIRKDAQAARVLVRVCCVIGASDGSFDLAEQKVVRDICTELGLNPAEFDL